MKPLLLLHYLCLPCYNIKIAQENVRRGTVCLTILTFLILQNLLINIRSIIIRPTRISSIPSHPQSLLVIPIPISTSNLTCSRHFLLDLFVSIMGCSVSGFGSKSQFSRSKIISVLILRVNLSKLLFLDII